MLIQCTLETPEGLTFVSWTLVTELSGSLVRLKGRASEVTLDLATVEHGGFEYAEPWAELKEDSKLRRESEGKWRSLLAMRFPSSTMLLLGESLGELAED